MNARPVTRTARRPRRGRTAGVAALVVTAASGAFAPVGAVGAQAGAPGADPAPLGGTETTTTSPLDPATTTTTTTTVPLHPVLPVPILSAPVDVDPTEDLVDGRTRTGVVVAASDALADVPLEGERYLSTVAARDAIAEELATATDRIVTAQAELDTLGGGAIAITQLADRALARVVKLTRIRDAARDDLRAIALERYTSDRDLEASLPPSVSDPAAVMDAAHRHAIERDTSDLIGARARRSQDALDRAIERTTFLAGRIRDVEARQRALQREVRDAIDDRDRASAALPGAQREARVARAAASVQGSDLPLTALDAYWRAALVMSLERPACRLDWSLLAGVGRSESNHGRFGGGEADAGGRVSVAIAGLPLDGTRNTRLIVDSDLGLLDGDPFVDRAVGAMQFIPGTWRRWARDGSGDGIADPQNLYDTALTAAVYLCNSGPLDTLGGARRAVYAYNRSDAYVDLVLRRAQAYAALPPPRTPTT